MEQRLAMEASVDIAFVGRGTSRKVVPPFYESNDGCIARGACAYVWPAGAIELDQVYGVRTLSPWHRDPRIQYCSVCARPIAPIDQLDAFAASAGIPRDQLNICVDCRSTRVRDRAGHSAAVPVTAGSDV